MNTINVRHLLAPRVHVPAAVRYALVVAIVGAQSGDEGKGRFVDMLATQANMVIRFQGGDNAGHTVVNDKGTFALHMVPSGVFNPETVCIVGAGCVANPEALWQELLDLEGRGVSTANVFIDDRCHVVCPWHIAIDQAREGSPESHRGSTKRGIGPSYENKASRQGSLRWTDLMNIADLDGWWRKNGPNINRWLESVGSDQRFTVEDFTAFVQQARSRFTGRVRDTLPMVQAVLSDPSQTILAEGQLGIMRDADYGVYPYVTASTPHCGGITAGAGIPGSKVQVRIGVMKAYTTCVGAGPFATELPEGDSDGDRMYSIGRERGATTGRRRRCGWLDIPMLHLAIAINDYTHMAMSKIDVLDGFKTIRVCTGYRLRDGKVITTVPTSVDVYESVEPIYEDMPGWQCDTTACRRWEDLPENARAYITFVQQKIGVPIRLISVGPERDSMLLQPEPPGF